jgi:probable phosphoglycerate mutase
MAIFLIRHAETVSNATAVVQLPTASLSARGERQARRLAARLAGAGIARIVSSDLERARMTAERLQEATGAVLEFDAALRERDYGDIRGTPYADLDVDIFAPDYAPPGGETWAVFHARVDCVWARMLERAATEGGHLAVVTHGLVCRAVATRHLDLPDGSPLPRLWGNTSVTVIEDANLRRVTRLDCTAHLDAEADGTPV